MGALGKKSLVIIGLTAPFALVGCGGGGDLADLKRWVAEVEARPKPPIEPLPAFKPYESFTYSAANLRSPFQPPIDVKPLLAGQSGGDVKPDPYRVREFLEEFSFDSLRMVGTINQTDGALWALVMDSDSGIHRVKTGNYVGRNHGRIIGVNEVGIDVIEIVPDGAGGWVERPRSMPLASSETE